MKFLHVPLLKVKSTEVESGYIIDNYLGGEQGQGFSVVRSHLNGKHPLMKNTTSNRAYYFLSGSGKFTIDGKDVQVKAEELLVIPKNTLYEFEGKFDAILISCPAFNPKDDVIYR